VPCNVKRSTNRNQIYTGFMVDESFRSPMLYKHCFERTWGLSDLVQDQKTPNDWQHPASMSENEGPLRSICVFCDALDGLNPLYAKAASELGEELAKRNISLVYGGACM
jgi:hypothetical protein